MTFITSEDANHVQELADILVIQKRIQGHCVRVYKSALGVAATCDIVIYSSLSLFIESATGAFAESKKVGKKGEFMDTV